MKRYILFLFSLLTFFVTPAFADVMPYYVNSISPNSIGVYQAPNDIKIYSEPTENSKLLVEATWSQKGYSCPPIAESNLFVVYLPKKNLAFLSVTDENDEGDWIEVLFIQNGAEKRGWVKLEDEFRFMNWRTFFNIYGRKYGLYYMKDAPESAKFIYGSAIDEAKTIGKITLPQIVKLTNVSGNWLLAIAIDYDKSQKIGWLKWRTISGEIYLFPNIK